jgi:hypothetical protein
MIESAALPELGEGSTFLRLQKLEMKLIKLASCDVKTWLYVRLDELEFFVGTSFALS